MTEVPQTPDGGSDASAEVLSAFLRLGCTSFGGPVAHLGYFRTEFVERRRWLTDESYADLVALCQFMPGPASSQVAMGLGLMRGGYAGLIAAFIGFTLPSFLLMAAAGAGLVAAGGAIGIDVIHALKLVAVAVVAHALLGMAERLCPDPERASIAIVGTVVALTVPGYGGQIATILLGAGFGLSLLKAADPGHTSAPSTLVTLEQAAAALGIFAVLLVGLMIAAELTEHPLLVRMALYFRVGSLVFGGGHVVLPMLQAELVPDLVDVDPFLAGYGLAQAVPGPLFSFSAFLGAADSGMPGAILGAGIACVMIFLPSLLLVVGLLPFWARVGRYPPARQALAGINAAVVGLLGAAFYQPVFTQTVHDGLDLALALVAFMALGIWRMAPWLVIVLAGAGAAVMSALS